MLTKSDLLSFRQCRRKLWLERNRQDLLPPRRENDRRIVDGEKVGEMARKLLGPDARELSYRDLPPIDAAKSAKAVLLEDPKKSAVEVPLIRADVYVRADALVFEPAGYVLQETKASTFPLKADKESADKPKEHYLDDAAIQAWVVEDSGIPCTRVELNLLNNRWTYPGNGNYDGLFRAMDVTDLVQKRKAEVPEWIKGAADSLAGEMPATTTGSHCKTPYACPFLNYCRGLEPQPNEHPIELLPDSAGKKLAKRLREEKGYVSILEPSVDELSGKNAALYQRIQRAHREGIPILEQAARDQMKSFPYPRFYLDFEGIDLPVPRWEGVRPYEQVPFQWSCHIEHRRDDFTHTEFLDLTGNDPSIKCIEALVIALSTDGPVFVYNATYEKTRLLQFAGRFPQYAGPLNSIVARLVDLLPIVRENFYDPRMKGSYSIKSVLPVIAPDLDYDVLEEVTDGTAAQVVYMQVIFDKLDGQRIAEIDRRLRTYCRQDTWAMVELAHFLEGSGRPMRPIEDAAESA